MTGAARIPILVALFVVLLAAAVPAPAAHNDDLADAALVTAIPFEDRHDTTGTTNEAGERATRCTGYGGSVWYRWTPSEALHVKIDTFGSADEFALSLWKGGGSMSTLKFLACDSGNLSRAARIVFDTQPGVTYSVRVAGQYEWDEGVLSLVIDETALPCEPVALGVSDTCYLSPAAP